MPVPWFWIAFGCLWGVSWLIFLPLTMHYALLFWNHQHLPDIKTRRPKMTMTLYAVGMINILIVRIYAAIIMIFNTEYTHINLGFATNEMLFWVLVYVFLMVGNLFCGRVWFFFYDWRRNEDLLKLKWAHKLLLTTVHNDIKKPWTIRYEKTLGNTKYICTIVFVHYVAFVLGFLIFGSIFGLNSVVSAIYLVSLALLPPNIWLVYLYIRCFRFYDGIGIRQELKHYLIVTASTMIPFAVLYVTMGHGLPRHLVVDLLFAAITFFVFLRMLRVPQLIKHVQRNRDQMVAKFLVGYRSNTSLDVNHIRSPRPATPSVSGRDGTGAARFTFMKMFKSEEALKLFANHCVSEYSVDNVLFLIEYHQVLYVLGQFAGAKKKEKKVTASTDLLDTLASPSVSKSASVSYDDIIKRSRMDVEKWCIPFPEKLISQKGVLKVEKTNYLKHCQIWKYLLNTYISDRSQSSINIASDVRYRIMLMFQTYDVELAATECDCTDIDTMEQYEGMNQALMELFDVAGKEIFHLLRRDSWVRFKSKPEYETLTEQMKSTTKTFNFRD
eukprot:199799_1